MPHLSTRSAKRLDADPVTDVQGDDSAARHLLLTPEGAALVGLEFASMRVSDAFATWVKHAHRRSDGPSLRFDEIVLLHCIRLCGPPQTLAELRLFTNAHALPRLQDGLRSLQRSGLIVARKNAGVREPLFALTRLGADVTARYAQLRERALVDLCKSEVGIVSALEAATALLERLVGLYRQAEQRLGDQVFLTAGNHFARSNERIASERRTHARKRGKDAMRLKHARPKKVRAPKSS